MGKFEVEIGRRTTQPHMVADTDATLGLKTLYLSRRSIVDVEADPAIKGQGLQILIFGVVIAQSESNPAVLKFDAAFIIVRLFRAEDEGTREARSCR
jgi:hypothetical protein